MMKTVSAIVYNRYLYEPDSNMIDYMVLSGSLIVLVLAVKYPDY